MLFFGEERWVEMDLVGCYLCDGDDVRYVVVGWEVYDWEVKLLFCV